MAKLKGAPKGPALKPGPAFVQKQLKRVGELLGAGGHKSPRPRGNGIGSVRST